MPYMVQANCMHHKIRHFHHGPHSKQEDVGKMLQILAQLSPNFLKIFYSPSLVLVYYKTFHPSAPYT